jgi:hypothetical protein
MWVNDDVSFMTWAEKRLPVLVEGGRCSSCAQKVAKFCQGSSSMSYEANFSTDVTYNPLVVDKTPTLVLDECEIFGLMFSAVGGCEWDDPNFLNLWQTRSATLQYLLPTYRSCGARTRLTCAAAANDNFDAHSAVSTIFGEVISRERMCNPLLTSCEMHEHIFGSESENGLCATCAHSFVNQGGCSALNGGDISDVVSRMPSDCSNTLESCYIDVMDICKVTPWKKFGDVWEISGLLEVMNYKINERWGLVQSKSREPGDDEEEIKEEITLKETSDERNQTSTDTEDGETKSKTSSENVESEDAVKFEFINLDEAKIAALEQLAMSQPTSDISSTGEQRKLTETRPGYPSCAEVWPFTAMHELTGSTKFAFALQPPGGCLNVCDSNSYAGLEECATFTFMEFDNVHQLLKAKEQLEGWSVYISVASS